MAKESQGGIVSLEKRIEETGLRMQNMRGGEAEDWRGNGLITVGLSDFEIRTRVNGKKTKWVSQAQGRGKRIT